MPRQAEESGVLYRPKALRRQGGLPLSVQQLLRFALGHPAERSVESPSRQLPLVAMTTFSSVQCTT
jgi:hypothetical protein